MRALNLQPPFVQLNAPYPAVWYLDAWFRNQGINSRAEDHSIELTRALFSRDGLARVFAAARVALKGRKHPDAGTARRIQAYFNQEELYLGLADGVLGYLSGEDPAFAYRLAVGAGLPVGMRVEAVLGDEGGIAPADAPALATAILNDLSDFISYALDPGFGVVRYAERLVSGARDFSVILEASQSSWVLGGFYRPILQDCFARFTLEPAKSPDEQILLCITVPFPGCLAAAVMAAGEARAVWGERVRILLGGGYVSTELRFLEAPEVFDHFDWLCYDGGYASLSSILGFIDKGDEADLYRVRWRDQDGKVIASGFPADESGYQADASCCNGSRAATANSGAAEAEARDIALVHPDYTGADFSRYLRIVDSPNPMHRLWNDTPWLKYRLAYGCYWKRCAFCDTQLDYIKRYISSDIDALLAAAGTASARTGLYGIHFTDEAMPVKLVRAFAERNRKRSRPFTFWGNARFDKTWTEEACATAAAGGLVAVSGGIEIATGRGLEIVDKGFTLTDLIRSLLAFKRSGILVHAYLIYGFPGQSDQEIADSAEMVRVLLAEGLVDSAFWHKFVLTRHSRLYARWEAGEVPALKPLVPPSRFAVNDLRFDGEDLYDKWTVPLDSALAAWADHGEFDVPLSKFLPKGLPAPRINAGKALRDAGVR
ncbi:MAG: radical SAM protein [Clostridia bacterium]